MKRVASAATALILAVMTATFWGATRSAQAGGASDSLDWQRMSLESAITEKLQKALASVIPEGSFFINTSIQLKPSARHGVIDSSQSAKGVRANEGLMKLPLGKLNIDVAPPARGVVANESAGGPDLFENIQAAIVHIFVDNSLPDAKRDLITQITESITDPVFGEGKADIQLDKIALKQSAVPKSEQDWKWWLGEFKTPAVSIFIALLLCAFSSFFFISYRRLELRKISILESQLGTGISGRSFTYDFGRVSFPCGSNFVPPRSLRQPPAVPHSY